MDNTSSILVTGGLGFIGSWYVKLLAEEGYYPVIIDKMTYAADVNRIKGIEDEIYIGDRLFVGDICDKELINNIIDRHNIECIVNFAAETHVDNAIKDSTKFVKSNFDGVQVLLDICRNYDEDIKFIQISTDEVYGSTKEGSFKETDKLNPGNPYSACKAGADLLCLSYFNTYGLDIMITRSSNNYGPWQHYEKFIPRVITLAMCNRPLEVYGDGDNVRDWLYVEDNCKGIKAIMEGGKPGEVYNIAAGNELTNNKIAGLIDEMFGTGVEYITDRLGHDYRYCIDFSKILQNLGWRPSTGFYDGLNKTIEWHMKQGKSEYLEATKEHN